MLLTLGPARGVQQILQASHAVVAGTTHNLSVVLIVEHQLLVHPTVVARESRVFYTQNTQCVGSHECRRFARCKAKVGREKVQNAGSVEIGGWQGSVWSIDAVARHFLTGRIATSTERLTIGASHPKERKVNGVVVVGLRNLGAHEGGQGPNIGTRQTCFAGGELGNNLVESRNGNIESVVFRVLKVDAPIAPSHTIVESKTDKFGCNGRFLIDSCNDGVLDLLDGLLCGHGRIGKSR